MGMAASQARFLGLTARKTNDKYEGQQINQQRTTLSNQSANYYNDLLGMSVPVHPSVDDYTKTVYTIEDGAFSNSNSSMIAQADGSYLISYTSSWTDDFAAVAAGSSVITRGGDAPDYKYNVGAKELRLMQTRDDADIDAMTDEELEAFKGNDEYLKTLSNDQLKKLLKEENEYINILNNQYANAKWMMRYVQNTTTGTLSPYFYKKEVLDSAIYSDTGSSQSNITAYTKGSTKKFFISFYNLYIVFTTNVFLFI